MIREKMEKLLRDNRLLLMEGAIVERLRRAKDISLHSRLINAPFIYDEKNGNVLRETYQAYIDIAVNAGVPFLMCTPTWRANYERVVESRVRLSINRDAVAFMKELRDAQRTERDQIKIGGMIGCKNDCYKPQEGLSIGEAAHFHTWQIEQLVYAGVDFLIAETLPNVNEAEGIAQAMAVTGTPYIISFVISREGCVLDGTALVDAIEKIDSAIEQKPLGFMVNCAYPTFLCSEQQPPQLFNRLIGYQANASALDHDELDDSDVMRSENVWAWGDEMIKMNSMYGVKILGGCCGTGPEHLHYISKRKSMKT